ncbi:MAG: HTH domain-containing protein [Fusobacteriaceae bacterium]|nr:HTH domain-containing protein [Fusobacteriaceae bacterium]
MEIRITEKDEKIFKFLFRLKYASTKNLSKYLNCSNNAIWKRVSRLKKLDYIESTWISSINNRVYSNGVSIRKYQKREQYKNKVKINKVTLPHHLLINDIYIFLIKNFEIEEQNIITEREIFFERTGILKKGRLTSVPDLVIKKDKQGKQKLIAIEVEKTRKTKKNIKEVFKNYAMNTSYFCVRYICVSEVIKDFVNNMAEEEKRKFIKAYTVEEFYNGIDFIGF